MMIWQAIFVVVAIAVIVFSIVRSCRWRRRKKIRQSESLVVEDQDFINRLNDLV
jgi:preprotein translocase subunit YajC